MAQSLHQITEAQANIPYSTLQCHNPSLPQSQSPLIPYSKTVFALYQIGGIVKVGSGPTSVAGSHVPSDVRVSPGIGPRETSYPVTPPQ